MCTSWVKGVAREYSLTNHTGPPVLWSPIRLAHCLNYSQSKTIKSNYDQLWIIRMPRRLIAQRDGAVSCHFQETVTPIVFFFSPLVTPSLSKKECWIFSKDACGFNWLWWQQSNLKIWATQNCISLLLACPSAFSPPSLPYYGGSHWKPKHWGSEMNDHRSVVCCYRCQFKMAFLAA